jgi:DNA-binding MarR family transcriptional regulator
MEYDLASHDKRVRELKDSSRRRVLKALTQKQLEGISDHDKRHTMDRENLTASILARWDDDTAEQVVEAITRAIS